MAGRRCSDAYAHPPMAEVGVLVDERRPVDALHRRERRDRVSRRDAGPYRVRVDPVDRQNGHATAQTLRERRLGRQRQVATDVVRAGVARLQAEAQDAPPFQPVVVDRVRMNAERQRMDRRLVSFTARHCDRLPSQWQIQQVGQALDTAANHRQKLLNAWIDYTWKPINRTNKLTNMVNIFI